MHYLHYDAITGVTRNIPTCTAYSTKKTITYLTYDGNTYTSYNIIQLLMSVIFIEGFSDECRKTKTDQCNHPSQSQTKQIIQ